MNPWLIFGAGFIVGMFVGADLLARYTLRKLRGGPGPHHPTVFDDSRWWKWPL